MDWLKTVLPTVATALGGPLAGVAVNFIADKLGLEDKTIEAVQAAISGASPEQLVQLKQIDADLQKYFAGLGIKLEEIAAADRASARDREAKTGDTLTPRALAGLIVLGWFLVQWFLLTHVVATEMREIVLRALGTLDMALGLVLGYYFGSSSSSRVKDELIAKGSVPR
jgi:hypothetical protein